jgi:hypothetical protein
VKHHVESLVGHKLQRFGNAFGHRGAHRLCPRALRQRLCATRV